MKIKPDLYLKGVFMGIAEIIPGVSGGTIAFITGIYEELIDSIKSINTKTLKILLSFKFSAFWREINGTFLITLILLCTLISLSLSKSKPEKPTSKEPSANLSIISR